MEHNIKIVDHVAQSKNLQNCKIGDKYQLSDITLCAYPHGEKFPKHKCLTRDCQYCSTEGIKDFLRPLEPYEEDEVQYLRWENNQMKKTNRSGVDVNVTKKILKQKKSTFIQMVNELVEKGATFAMHLINAKWQDASLNNLKMAIPDQSVVQILDFAENFSCDFQDEISSAHWQHQQATVHPTVCYYKCHGCDKNITESLVFILDDEKHDFHAVHTYSSIAHRHLSQIRGLDINRYIQYTDGCSSQYKSKHAFMDISCASEEFGCTIQRNYFGTRHGKGAADGESAVV